ncbi:hypothetical protein [Microbacterium sp.]|uniref:hypothetical protein n=1 Tax=Microbacterium sp. TaxID=51671 RepID=UPI002603C0F4|nr:hypothetical protein [Microbacterium sp.]
MQTGGEARRTLSIVVATGVALALLSGCTPAMNEEAVAAAEEYSADLASWAVDVSDAAALLPDEQEKPLIEALEAMPTLTEVADAEETVSERLAAHRV